MLQCSFTGGKDKCFAMSLQNKNSLILWVQINTQCYIFFSSSYMHLLSQHQHTFSKIIVTMSQARYRSVLDCSLVLVNHLTSELKMQPTLKLTWLHNYISALIRVACTLYKRGEEAGICEMEVELELTRRHRLQGDMCLVESCPGIKKCAIPIFNGQNLLHLPPLDPLCRCKRMKPNHQTLPTQTMSNREKTSTSMIPFNRSCQLLMTNSF